MLKEEIASRMRPVVFRKCRMSESLFPLTKIHFVEVSWLESDGNVDERVV